MLDSGFRRNDEVRRQLFLGFHGSSQVRHHLRELLAQRFGLRVVTAEFKLGFMRHFCQGRYIYRP